jgi:hypothetical protein
VVLVHNSCADLESGQSCQRVAPRGRSRKPGGSGSSLGAHDVVGFSSSYLVFICRDERGARLVKHVPAAAAQSGQPFVHAGWPRRQAEPPMSPFTTWPNIHIKHTNTGRLAAEWISSVACSATP